MTVLDLCLRRHLQLRLLRWPRTISDEPNDIQLHADHCTRFVYRLPAFKEYNVVCVELILLINTRRPLACC